MAVAETFAMPNQPAAGHCKHIPLGGDGFSAPHSAYSLVVNLAGAAGGGNSTITIYGDERYTQMVSYMRNEIVGVAADTDQRMFILLDTLEQIQINDPAIHSAVTSSASVLWKPPGVIFSSQNPTDARLLFQFLNVDGDTHNIDARVYNFDKRARELTPLSILLASLPR